MSLECASFLFYFRNMCSEVTSSRDEGMCHHGEHFTRSSPLPCPTMRTAEEEVLVL